MSSNLEGPPISGITRRTFLLGALAMAGGCTAMTKKRPPLDDLYGHIDNDDQPPLIVIPGAFGSRLLDTWTGREI